MCWIHFYAILFKHDFIDLLLNALPLSTHILFDWRLISSKIFLKALVISIALLSFKGITHAYLLKISITHNKNLNPLLNLLINCISSRSTPQILSIKDEYTFRFLNSLIISLHNYSANSLFDLFSVLMLLRVFLPKYL